MNTKEKQVVNEKYFKVVFGLLKKRDGIVLSDKKNRFNDTELRLLSEVLEAKYAGKRLISTQIATRLGVTRSAISQIVNRLEGEGVIQRFPDPIDKKIAYVEMTETTLAAYEENLKVCTDFIGKIVKKFGENKFDKMQLLLAEFMDLIEAEKQAQKEAEKAAIKAEKAAARAKKAAEKARPKRKYVKRK